VTAELPQTGQVLGQRYELAERLGDGGMAVVYRAFDRVEGRQVALKLLTPRYLGRPEREQRIIDEAEYLRQLRGHPNIVELVDAGRFADHHDWPFLATELLAGRALHWILIDRTFSRANIHTIAAQLAAALETCHAHGIVHRDLTPANVFVDEATMQVELFDFSHAGSLTTPRLPSGSGGRLTGIHDIPGTSGYMGPEQAMAAPAVAAMDVFAFGVLLHELITGRNPFPDSDRSRYIQAQRAGGLKVPRLDAWAYQLPEAWADLIESCTDNELVKRPTMARVASLLETIDVPLAQLDGDTTQPIDVHVLEHLREGSIHARHESTERLGAKELAQLQHPATSSASLDDAPTIRRPVESAGFGDWTRRPRAGSALAAEAVAVSAPVPESSFAVSEPSPVLEPAFARKSAPPVFVLAPLEHEPEPSSEFDDIAEVEPPLAARRRRLPLALGLIMLVMALGLALWGASRMFGSDGETPTSPADTLAAPPSMPEPTLPEPNIQPTQPSPSEPAIGPDPRELDPLPRESEEPESVDPAPKPAAKKSPPALSGTGAPPPPEDDPPAPNPCDSVEKEGRAARDALAWSTVIKLTSKKRCWASDDERTRLRVEALMQAREWAECVAAAEASTDAKVLRWSKFCANHL